MTTTVTNDATSQAASSAGVGLFDWLTIDIETVAGRPEDAERWMRMHWSPSSQIKKPETIGQKWFDALEGKRQKLALLDGAQVICIGLRSKDLDYGGGSVIEFGCLHCMGEHLARDVKGATVQGFASQTEMLIALRNILDARAVDETTIVGHNVRRFDLPMLRHAFVREGVRLPMLLSRPDILMFDTMVEYRRFSLVDKPFISLADLLEVFGLTSHKQAMTGADVGELHAAGQFETIVQYNLLDVIAESEVFLRMTGQPVEGLK